MYCGFGFRGMVGDDPVELEWYLSPEHRLLDFRLPHQAPDFIYRQRSGAPSGVLCNGVLRCALGQVVVSLDQQVLSEVFPHPWLLEVAGAYSVFRSYVYTSSVIAACHHVQEGQLFK